MPRRSLLVQLLAVLCLTVIAGMAIFQLFAPQTSPVAKDGFPTGQGTPEGVAADFERAEFQKDYVRSNRLCIRPFGTDEVRTEYQDSQNRTTVAIEKEATGQTFHPDWGKEITKVLAARHLSDPGPLSYAKTFGFEDVEFVDVKLIMVNGGENMDRLLTIKDGGKWYVYPDSGLNPLLSVGLNQERSSGE